MWPFKHSDRPKINIDEAVAQITKFSEAERAKKEHLASIWPIGSEFCYLGVYHRVTGHEINPYGIVFQGGIAVETKESAELSTVYRDSSRKIAPWAFSYEEAVLLFEQEGAGHVAV